MIGRLVGTLVAKNPPQIVLDLQGLGYEVEVPMSTFYGLPALGEAVTLLIHHLVREDAQILYGFASEAERQTFRTLLKVTGIGARTALALLSGLSVNELAQAVAQQETAILVRVPGIGKKTAERLLLELKDKLGPLAVSGVATPSGINSDIVQALIALGYSEKEAVATAQALPAGLSVNDGIKQALRSLSR